MNEALTRRRFAVFYRILGFMSFYFIVCAFAVPAVPIAAIGVLPSYAGVLVLMLTGYWLQAGWSAVSGFRREEDTRSYEAERKYYKPVRALPVFVAAVVLAFIASGLADDYLRWVGEQQGQYYDPDSLVPLFMAGIVFVVTVLGSFVWFFPYERLTTGRAAIVGLTVMFIAYMLYSVMGAKAMTVTALSFGGFVLSAVIASNQNMINKSYRGTVVAFMTPRARIYNLLLSFSFIGISGVLMCIAYLIVNGISVLVRMLIFIVLNAAGGVDRGYTEDGEEALYSLSNLYIYGAKEAEDSLNYWLFVIFAVLFVIAVVYFVFRRTPEVKGLVRRIRDWLLWLFDAIFRPMIDFADSGSDQFYNYVDVEDKLQNAVIRERREGTGKRRSYRDFISELRSKRDGAGRYRFAYYTFVTQLRSMPLFVKKSDTPREIAGRLSVSRKFAGNTEVGRITGEFEKIEFSAAGADAATDETLEKLCEIIRDNM